MEGTTTTASAAAAADDDASCYTTLETRVSRGALATALHLGEPLGRAPADWVDDMLARLMRANPKVVDTRAQIASRLGVRGPCPSLPFFCSLAAVHSRATLCSPDQRGLVCVLREDVVMTGRRTVACKEWGVCVVAVQDKAGIILLDHQAPRKFNIEAAKDKAARDKGTASAAPTPFMSGRQRRRTGGLTIPPEQRKCAAPPPPLPQLLSVRKRRQTSHATAMVPGGARTHNP
jgi:hypothetical protein